MEKRRLTAIMFTDMVGYTSMMGQDEEKAFKILENNRIIHKDLLVIYEGRLLKEIGDGMLCSFDSASNAVKCAIELIRKSHDYKGLTLRIGIHIGEVVFSRHDVFGDGVNIASRIEAMAIPGSVLISGKVYDEIKNKHGIQVRQIGTYTLKNDTQPRVIYAITNAKLKVPSSKDLYKITEDNPELQNKVLTSTAQQLPQTSNKKFRLTSARVLLTALFTAMALVFGSFLFISFRNNTRVKWAREEAIIEIEQLIEKEQFKTAYHIAEEAEKYIPDDPLLKRLWPKMEFKLNLNSDPSGAKVYRKLIGENDTDYELIGITPLDSVRTYNSFSDWMIEKEGYDPLEFMNTTWVVQDKTYKLFESGELPENMLFVPFNQWGYWPTGWISGLENTNQPDLQNYLIDKYEVSNKDFKRFMDQGGYRNRTFWKEPFIKEGHELSWEEGLALFVDKTGLPGPSNWEVGDYPNGMENYSVSGISWFEAMAYAAFAGKNLPTVYHWIYAATPGRGDLINPASNFLGDGPAPRGSHKGLGVYGTYDMAGNVREWCLNPTDGSEARFILGGAWDELPYNFSNARAINPFDRSVLNGFRCIKYLENVGQNEKIYRSIPLTFRDYSIEKPVNDETYQNFLYDFEYEKTPFDEEIIPMDFGDPDFTCQKIFINSPYDEERLCLYLFLPNKSTPPFQIIFYFPSAWAQELDDFESSYELTRFEYDFFIKSGRAVAYPIFPGTYGRDWINKNQPWGRIKRKSNFTAISKEVQRDLDYLTTRNDIDKNQIGFYGKSWGGALGPVAIAVEKRIKAAVLNVGGLFFGKSFPETDVINYLPRVTAPILMLNGRHDHIFPIETSSKPMFKLLGTPSAHKKQIIYEVGHTGPVRHELIKESLNWFDTYLGPVKPGN